MRIRLIAAALLAGLVFAGCESSNHRRDVEGVPTQKPDAIELYANVNEHPNLVKVCIDGVAFATTTRQHIPVIRVEDWDKTCPNAKSK